MEVINDQMERTVPIQGGGLLHVEWDSGIGRQSYAGESVVTMVHPKQLTPQPGVTSGIRDMDSIILNLPVTESYVRRTYGVDVHGEAESDPELRSAEGAAPVEGMLTMHVGYEREDEGIRKFVWVNDVVLEDIADYQARRLKRCTKCGAIEPTGVEPLEEPTADGSYPGGGDWELEAGELASENARPARKRKRDGTCPFCGQGRFEAQSVEYEEVWGSGFDVTRPDGETIHVPGEHWETAEDGTPVLEPTRIRFYKPDVYPVLLMKNVSKFGALLGQSDVDIIERQQNTINRLEQKMLDLVLKSGSYISLPPDPAVKLDATDGKEIRLKTADQKAYLDVYDMQGNIEQPMALVNHIYEEARYTIGITDSFQGREDTTATSGKAKEISANQAAGRFMSKRVMKRAFWAELFETLFKFELAYRDDRRPVIGMDKNGQPRDAEFSKYMFLEQDENGEWYYNTDFLFDVDSSSTLAADRSNMWKELYAYYTGGAMGDPAETGTRIKFWHLMEEQHYPTAGKIKAMLVEEQEKEAQLQQAAAQMQMQAQERAQRDAQQKSEEQAAMQELAAMSGGAPGG